MKNQIWDTHPPDHVSEYARLKAGPVRRYNAAVRQRYKPAEGQIAREQLFEVLQLSN